MSKIQEAASYRGIVVEHAVGVTSKGLPQFVAKLRALEKYDAAEKVWINWANQEDCEITAYLSLISNKGEPIFHAKDIQKVFEWDGASLVDLNSLDLESAEVQFEVQDHEYNENTTTQVANIRGYNDEPGTSVKKLGDDELAALNAKFSNSFKKLSGGPKAVSAKATSKAAAKKNDRATTLPPPPPAPSEEEVMAEIAKPVVEVPVEEAIEEFKKNDAPPPPPVAAAVKSAKTMTYEGAWAECYNKKAATVDDKTIGASFASAMHRQCPGQSEQEITSEDWLLIVNAVIGECG